MVLLLGLVLPLPLEAQVAPDMPWWQLATAHFRVIYGEGLEPLARRAADRAERAYAALGRTFMAPPEGRIDLVVADNVDFTNAFATPWPEKRIVIYAHPPVGEETLGFFDEWVDLVIIHELVHIFHLDYAGGLWGALRKIFGRVVFPEAGVPDWIIEGLATYYESHLTRAGRIKGSRYRMMVRMAALNNVFPSIDQAIMLGPAWPGPERVYIFGSLFLDYLHRQYGLEKTSRFVKEIGRRILPFQLDRSARTAYGTSFSAAWQAWREAEIRNAHALRDSLAAQGLIEAEILTTTGYETRLPRLSPSGTRLAYIQQDGHSEVVTRLLDTATGTGRVLARRHWLGPTTWSRDERLLYYTQVEGQDPYTWWSDLYELDVASGIETRLTRGRRWQEPDLSPDGQWLVMVENGQGTTWLVRYHLGQKTSFRLTLPDPLVHWSRPVWSPDGQWIAAVRWTPGAHTAIVVLNPAGEVVHEIALARTLKDTPAWSPDGRYLLFASDRTGITNLYAVDLQPARAGLTSFPLKQITNTLGGIFEPAVDPRGRWIYCTTYQADGYHIGRLPYRPEAWFEPAPARPESRPEPSNRALYRRTAGGPAETYTSRPGLAPSWWLPVVTDDAANGLFLGAVTASWDPIFRHFYLAALAFAPGSGKTQAQFDYTYTGLGLPQINTTFSQSWTRSPAPEFPAEPISEQERLIGIHTVWPRVRMRSFARLDLGLDASRRTFDSNGFPRPLALRDGRWFWGGTAAAGYDTRRAYPYSFGLERGFTLGGRLRLQRSREGAGKFTAAPLYLKPASRGWRNQGVGYLSGFHPVAGPGYAHSVMAGRLAFGFTGGAARLPLRVGGYSGVGPWVYLRNSSPLSGSERDFPVRGYATATLKGSRALSASLEYRFPLVLVGHGYKTWPLFLDRLWGLTFLDLGTAWGVPDKKSTGSALSLGAELHTQLGLFYAVPSDLHVGLVRRLKAAGSQQAGWGWYVRLRLGIL